MYRNWKSYIKGSIRRLLITINLIVLFSCSSPHTSHQNHCIDEAKQGNLFIKVDDDDIASLICKEYPYEFIGYSHNSILLRKKQ